MNRAPLAIALLMAACGQKPSHDGHAAPPASVPLTAAQVGHEGHGTADAASPAGYAPVILDATQAAAIGLRVVPVEERHFQRTVRTIGVVTLDETRTSHVHAKVRGWIDGIHVDFVGKKVSAGQPLASIYSQDVHAAEIEFLTVLDRVRGRSTAPAGEFAQAEARAQEQLLTAARRRLSLWDVPKSEIDRLERTHEAARTFPLLAPRAGVVVDKQALDGMYVDPSVELYTVSDLSKVWVLADVFEADVPFVHVGDAARLDVEGTSGSIEAKVAFLPPTIDETTRTLKVRFELKNPDGKLRPGSFVTVAIDLGLAHGLAVPESAVIRTGTRNVVFVVHGGDDDAKHLEPREVKLGPLVSGFYRVETGVTTNERVAVSAQFLLDSESRLRATGGGGGAGHGHH
jgi:membrane fusion protein, copper/silver efflux system